MDISAPDASFVPSGKAAQRAQNRARLARIADILGCPVETFAEGASSDNQVFEANELLRLWLAIEDAGDRGKVLALAHELARR